MLEETNNRVKKTGSWLLKPRTFQELCYFCVERKQLKTANGTQRLDVLFIRYPCHTPRHCLFRLNLNLNNKRFLITPFNVLSGWMNRIESGKGGKENNWESDHLSSWMTIQSSPSFLDAEFSPSFLCRPFHHPTSLHFAIHLWLHSPRSITPIFTFIY